MRAKGVRAERLQLSEKTGLVSFSLRVDAKSGYSQAGVRWFRVPQLWRCVGRRMGLKRREDAHR